MYIHVYIISRDQHLPAAEMPAGEPASCCQTIVVTTLKTLYTLHMYNLYMTHIQFYKFTNTGDVCINSALFLPFSLLRLLVLKWW